MKQYIYIYRLTTDTGNAPCIFENGYKKTNLLSLACCKGAKIRKKDGKPIRAGLRHEIGVNHQDKDDEVFVVGTYKDCFLYVSRVNNILKAEQYFAKNSPYKKRQDCIYQFTDRGISYDNDKYVDQFARRKNFNTFFHPEDIDRIKHDVFGGFVLLSNSFVYFGKDYEKYPVPNDLRDLLPKRQERKVFKSSDDGNEYCRVKDKIDDLLSSGFISDEPVQKLVTNCQGGCQR